MKRRQLALREETRNAYGIGERREEDMKEYEEEEKQEKEETRQY